VRVAVRRVTSVRLERAMRLRSRRLSAAAEPQVPHHGN
jgi:hypothetical protein